MVYLEKTGDSQGSRPTYVPTSDPPVLTCRWEDKAQEIILPFGRVVKSSAYILSAVPVTLGSLLFLNPKGVKDLTTWKALPTYPNVPTAQQGAFEVLLCKATPDLQGDERLYEIYV